MAASFFFYDLETSGFDARAARIMQFAGQRTDMNMQPIGEPVNLLIKLTPDVLPDPDAIMVTGITPQQTLQDGLTEAEFLQEFYSEVVKPDTIFVGFNSVRFDDEFMRYLHWRNYYDAYEWQWANGCGRWDMLDVVRMTRALRPEGIKWPVTSEGKPTNRLELLTKKNGLEHTHAHDALSDVHATIAVAKLIKDAQPDLFNYLLDCRGKKKVSELVLAGQPFVYTSGRYSGETWHTSAAVLLSKHPQQDCAIVYDLRHDPTPYVNMSVQELVAAWKYNKDPDAVRLPVKTLKYNRCPAVAPLGVMKADETQARLQLPLSIVSKHLAILKQYQTSFAANILKALEVMDVERSKDQAKTTLPVDAMLYDGFVVAGDKQLMQRVRTAPATEITSLGEKFSDTRLQQLVPLYKARNHPSNLSSDERAIWDDFCKQQLLDGQQQSRAAKYFGRLQALAAGTLTSEQEYLLEELQLYGEAILPDGEAD